MNIEELVALIPEDKRTEANELLKKAVLIETRADAEKLIDNNQQVRSVLDAVTSKRVDNALQKFQAEKMEPMLHEQVQAKLKELNPEKQPWELELESVKKELAQTKADALRKEMTALAVSKAQELGLPANPEFISRFVGQDQDSTLEQIQRLAGDILTPWRESAVTEMRTKLTNGAGKQEQGASTAKIISRTDFNALSPSDRVQVAQSMAKGEISIQD